jgi:DNA-binding response OmpR family regulator
MRVAALAQNDHVLDSIRHALEAQGIEVLSFTTLERLTAGLEGQEFGAILLEGLQNHLELCLAMLQLRVEAQTAIIIVGTGGTAAIAHALGRGADDYAFANGDVERAIQRIIARIGARVQRHRRLVFRAGGFELDSISGMIEYAGTRVRLTTREALLAQLLFENLGRVVAIDRLCIALCGASDASAVRSVNQYVYQLRRKLKRLAVEGDRLRVESVYGTGYRLGR